MLKPVPVLKRTAEFDSLFKHSKKTSDPTLSILYKNSKELKIAIQISRKQGNAVERNRARRLIKEFFRLNQDKIEFQEILIIVRAELLNNYDETSKRMLKLLQRAELLK